ncbi:MAG: hypothetical protein LBR10_10850, partial [Prevotellaceae bacterium]|jgi:hypothetical protein|nr:hypothetical protein [Prevotellaceae bacterium]
MYDDNLTLGAILKDGELFKAYPELKTYPVEITNAGNILGGFDNETKTISLDFMLSRSTLAHEIQHALQHIEGFARGANASDKNYLRSADEAEARNIEHRINMTPEQRRALLAAETEYVAREDQIFLYDGLGEQKMAEETTLEAVNQQFNQELQQYIDGKLSSTHQFNIGNPTDILSNHLPNIPLWIKQNVFKKASKKHGIALQTLKNLPKSLSNPIFIFKSKDGNSKVILTEITDNKGNNILAAIHLNAQVQKGNKRLEVNDIRSLHGKDKEKVLDWINYGLLEYTNKETGLKYISEPPSPSNSERALGNIINSATKIIQNFQNSKLPGENSHISTQKFTLITPQALTDLTDLLKKSNLAKEVITDKAEFDKQLKEVGGTEFKNRQGEVYGFVTPDGTVYLDPTKLNANTPIHEFGHLWQSFIEKNNPELYKKGCDLLVGSSYMEEVRKNPAYANLNKKQQVDEAMAMAIGDNGERFVNEKNLDKKNQIQKWLRKVWAWTGEKMGIRDLSPTQIRNLNLKQFIDGAVEDLVSGKKIQETPSVSGPSAETEQIKQCAIANGTFMKAPNGQPTNLNERQWLQARTEAFKKWFGDWENDPKNASKVVDKNGEPLVVYHFTSERFTAFDLSEARQNADIPAFFFSPNIDDWKDMGNNKMGVFLNITNPVEKPNADMQGKKVREELENSGYNGTYSTEDNEIVEYAAFNPSQIKSATNNNGNFDEKSDDIRFQFAGEQGAAALDKAEKKFTPITRQEKDVVPVKIGGVKLSSEQQKAIVAGEQVKVVGVTDKSGQKHTVHVQWNVKKKKLEYTKNKPVLVSKNPSKKEKKNRPKL